jgi:hypothetical protein
MEERIITEIPIELGTDLVDSLISFKYNLTTYTCPSKDA